VELLAFSQQTEKSWRAEPIVSYSNDKYFPLNCQDVGFTTQTVKRLRHTAVAAIADVTELVSWRPLASYHVISAGGLLDVVLHVSINGSPETTA